MQSNDQEKKEKKI